MLKTLDSNYYDVIFLHHYYFAYWMWYRRRTLKKLGKEESGNKVVTAAVDLFLNFFFRTILFCHPATILFPMLYSNSYFSMIIIFLRLSLFTQQYCWELSYHLDHFTTTFIQVFKYFSHEIFKNSYWRTLCKNDIEKWTDQKVTTPN